MVRNTGTAMQYICLYATVCGVMSLLALYGTMDHSAVPKSANKTPQHARKEAGPSGKDFIADAVDNAAMADAAREHRQADADMDPRLRAIDAKMQLVLKNSTKELTNFGRRVTDWDARREKLQQQAKKSNSILLVSSSHPYECENAHGDYMMLKSLKNKVDYCRLHGLELYHNMDMLDEKMVGWWVKLFSIHMLMLARPDVEWILWMDSDAVFTNMTFALPLEKYKDHNLVLQGWDSMIYQEKSWVGLNTGVFLLRNCQWSIDLLHEWIRFSPKGRVREAAGALFCEAFAGRPLVDAEDQSAFVYLLLTQRSRWAAKVYLENSYHLQGFFEEMTMQTSQHSGMGVTWWPFVTHFTGCQICSGKPNTQYDVENCHRHIERAYKIANNQVLQHCGFTYVSLQDSLVKRI